MINVGFSRLLCYISTSASLSVSEQHRQFDYENREGNPLPQSSLDTSWHVTASAQNLTGGHDGQTPAERTVCTLRTLQKQHPHTSSSASNYFKKLNMKEFNFLTLLSVAC